MKNMYEIQICHKDMAYRTICCFHKYKNARNMLERLTTDRNFKNINFRIIRTILTLTNY